MHFEVYPDTLRHWRWRLKARNGEIIANGGEWYYNKSDCLHAIGLVMDTNRQTPVYDATS